MKSRILMCRPEFYAVDYVINPWMEGNVQKSTVEIACEQWEGLHKELQAHASIELIEGRKGAPDLVFTANAGLVLGSKVVLSRFYHPERQVEEPYFKQWFENHGFETLSLPNDIPFEGAGDALLDRSEHLLWAGYGFRSELQSHSYIADWLDIEVVSLRLTDQRFYHLDTCFCPLSDGYLLYYPAAFDRYSLAAIEDRVPEEKRIAVAEGDATTFACNAVNLGKQIVLNKVTPELRLRLEGKGFTVHQTPLNEFIRAGGAAKCLTLRLDEEPLESVTHRRTQVRRTLRLDGHILDKGLLNQVLDEIVENGGSFQILSLEPGQQRNSSSSAKIDVIAPDALKLEEIIARLIGLGGVVRADEEQDVVVKKVEQKGVAPEDFYITTIYPTEVRVQGEWLPVQHQRMDACIAVKRSGKTVQADCCLMRDLEVGQEVVVGVEGVRTQNKSPSMSKSSHQEFSFMASEVSSERRVELVVEQIAWELRRIRERGGKVVVTAGPVVVHTGGGEHLAKLIRDGYVHSLLGGNAIAVHDIENSFMGTSLGVDLSRGVVMKGGHQHHLRSINTIRKYGGIKQAVDAGRLTSGIMYECVKNDVPFVLAGSIRDDGPLPETEMDIIKAQQRYTEEVRSADMILMLSTMLHSIGVGNMTPAGVKLICVDINPAVVTKLSDRGSLQSVGVVTDVGLFLSLLRRQLDSISE